MCFFTTTAKPLDESDPSEWAQQTLRAIEEAKKIAEKNNAEGIILLYEFEEFSKEQPCRSNEQYSEETRIKLYNDLLNATKEHVVGFMPVSTPLFACDSENLLKVTEEWYKKHL